MRNVNPFSTSGATVPGSNPTEREGGGVKDSGGSPPEGGDDSETSDGWVFRRASDGHEFECDPRRVRQIVQAVVDQSVPGEISPDQTLSRLISGSKARGDASGADPGREIQEEEDADARAWSEAGDRIAEVYAAGMTEDIKKIKRRGGEVIVMEVVDGGIDVFDDVEVRFVTRTRDDPPLPASDHWPMLVGSSEGDRVITVHEADFRRVFRDLMDMDPDMDGEYCHETFQELIRDANRWREYQGATERPRSSESPALSTSVSFPSGSSD